LRCPCEASIAPFSCATHVLLVEDNLVTSCNLAQICPHAGIGSDRVGTGEEAIDIAGQYGYDLILLVVMMPETDGVDIIRRMRRAGVQTPVLVLTDRSRATVKLHAFRAGADDYMVQPFDTEELIARIHAISRRSRVPGRAVLTCGSLNVDLDAKEASVGSTKVVLTSKEFAVLELLVLRKGTILSKEAIVSNLYYGMDQPVLKIIDVYICKLRQKLAAAGALNAIDTVWGVGYILREPRLAPLARGNPLRGEEGTNINHQHDFRLRAVA